jgi:hypothetical protein
MMPANYREVSFFGAAQQPNEAATARYFGQLSGESPKTGTCWRKGADLNRRDPSFRTCFRASRAFPFSGEKVSQAKRGSPKVVDVKVSRTAGVVSKDWL